MQSKSTSKYLSLTVLEEMYFPPLSTEHQANHWSLIMKQMKCLRRYYDRLIRHLKERQTSNSAVKFGSVGQMTDLAETQLKENAYSKREQREKTKRCFVFLCWLQSPCFTARAGSNWSQQRVYNQKWSLLWVGAQACSDLFLFGWLSKWSRMNCLWAESTVWPRSKAWR